MYLFEAAVIYCYILESIFRRKGYMEHKSCINCFNQYNRVLRSQSCTICKRLAEYNCYFCGY